MATHAHVENEVAQDARDGARCLGENTVKVTNTAEIIDRVISETRKSAGISITTDGAPSRSSIAIRDTQHKLAGGADAYRKLDADSKRSIREQVERLVSEYVEQDKLTTISLQAKDGLEGYEKKTDAPSRLEKVDGYNFLYRTSTGKVVVCLQTSNLNIKSKTELQREPDPRLVFKQKAPSDFLTIGVDKVFSVKADGETTRF